MDHYHNPRNKGELKNPDFTSYQHNPLCGDIVSMQGIVEQDCIKQLMFEGSGCVISQATASLLTQNAIGKTIAEVENFNVDFMQSLIGMNLGPTRLKCLLLPLHTLQEGLKKIERRK